MDRGDQGERDAAETGFRLSGRDATGRQVVLAVTAAGKVARADIEVALADVPGTVIAEARLKYSKFKLDSAMAVREKGKLSGYTLDGTILGKDASEVSLYVSADGTEVKVEKGTP